MTAQERWHDAAQPSAPANAEGTSRGVLGILGQAWLRLSPRAWVLYVSGTIFGAPLSATLDGMSSMPKFRPKTQMLLLGWGMIALASILFGGVLMLLPIYVEIKKGSREIPPGLFPPLMGDVLVMLSVIAAFLLISTRAVFRNRAHLGQEGSASIPALPIPRKRSALSVFGWCALGSVLGAGLTFAAATVYYGKIAARGFLTVESLRLMQAGQRATGAYCKESRPIAIYELSQYLTTLKQAEKIPDNPTIRKDSTYLSMTLAHGRLAKLYAEAGETNLSAEHVAEAIHCSTMTAHLVITNQAGVSNHVALWDRVIARMSSNPQGRIERKAAARLRNQSGVSGGCLPSLTLIVSARR